MFKSFSVSFLLANLCLLFFMGCSKKDASVTPPPAPPTPALTLSVARVDNATIVSTSTNYNTPITALIKLQFNNALDKSTVASAISLHESGANNTPLSIVYQNGDSAILLTPQTPLKYLSRYSITIRTSLLSVNRARLGSEVALSFVTQIDSTDKFAILNDNALLDLVQQQTFKYFWDYAHPVSGLARERSNATPETVTSGGSGFGIMAIPVGINRNFITRAQGLARMQKIVDFLKTKAQKFHGAFPHWLNGTSGTVIPFSTKDNGADLVETALLMQGLLTARQYFNEPGAEETALRNDINLLWNGVEWSWFRQNNQNVLYWHWSPNYNWEMNVKIQGWNETLITYILAASSPTFPITQAVYREGFARNGAMVNNNSYYGYPLPLGPDKGGPLFFAHYSFLGVNPNGLTDLYANYQTQVTNHTKINHEYCKANPKGFFGYSDLCWGLTASDVPGGYAASEPNNDIGVIAPTAALSSMPYTPVESMNALKFFYYKLGDKLFKQYGFVDAFSLKDIWFADSFLAIDQGPIILMIENHRSKLLWNLFTSCPEVKNGMKNVLGFTAPYL